MATRIRGIHKHPNEDNVVLIAENGNIAGNIAKVDDEIEIHFPVSGAFVTKEQAAFIAAHIITLITT